MGSSGSKVSHGLVATSRGILGTLDHALRGGLLGSEFVKVNLSSNSWNFYSEDFDWVKSRTNPDSIFISNGKCVPFNIERTSLYATKENIARADYIWVNQNFRLDRVSILDKKTLDYIESKNFKLVYSNSKTQTKIYYKND